METENYELVVRMGTLIAGARNPSCLPSKRLSRWSVSALNIYNHQWVGGAYPSNMGVEILCIGSRGFLLRCTGSFSGYARDRDRLNRIHFATCASARNAIDGWTNRSFPCGTARSMLLLDHRARSIVPSPVPCVFPCSSSVRFAHTWTLHVFRHLVHGVVASSISRSPRPFRSVCPVLPWVRPRRVLGSNPEQ